MLHRIANKTKLNLENMKLGTTTYACQFRSAMCVNGGNLDGATVMDYVLHFITFFWKVISHLNFIFLKTDTLCTTGLILVLALVSQVS